MKTIELDLEKDSQLDSLSGMIKSKKISLGQESFQLKVYSASHIGELLYAAFLLLLVKYLVEEMNRSATSTKSNTTFTSDKKYYDSYFKDNDVSKLENKIEKDFKINIEFEKKNPLDEVFGLWKNKDITLANIREKAWQRAK